MLTYKFQQFLLLVFPENWFLRLQHMVYIIWIFLKLRAVKIRTGIVHCTSFVLTWINLLRHGIDSLHLNLNNWCLLRLSESLALSVWPPNKQSLILIWNGLRINRSAQLPFLTDIFECTMHLRLIFATVPLFCSVALVIYPLGCRN